MNIHIKITQNVYEAMLKDLVRPHPFAAERVGFAASKIGNRDGETLLVMLTEYITIPDENYVEDEFVGARIDSSAIRSAMQHVLSTKEGIFHVHLHPHRGTPKPSYTDRREIPPLVSSFRNVAPTAAHGIFLLSKDKAFASVIPPQKSNLVSDMKISLIGRNLKFLED